MYFNFCEVTQQTCRDQARDYAHLIRPDASCIHYTQDNTRALFKSQYQNSFVEYIDPDSKSFGIALIYENQNQKCQGNIPYSLKINMYCDPSKNNPTYQIDSSAT